MKGEITYTNVQNFHEAVASLQQKGILECVLNLEQVSFFDSVGISELFLLVIYINEAGGQLVIASSGSIVYETLKMAGVFKVAKLVDSLQEGLALFPDCI